MATHNEETRNGLLSNSGIIGNDNPTNIKCSGFGDNEKLPPKHEIDEYLLSHRTDDLTEIPSTNKITLDIDEHEVLRAVLVETEEAFRMHLRDAVVEAFAHLTFDHNDKPNITKICKNMRNKIKIDLIISTDVELANLRAEDYEGEMVTFECNIANWSETRGITHFIALKCPECDDVVVRQYKEELKVRCSKDHVFYEEQYATKGEGLRRVTLKEIISDFDSKNMPMSITADFFGSELAKITLSDNVIVTGMFRSLPLRKEKGKISREFIPTIQVINVRRTDSDEGKLPTPEMMEEFEQLESEGKLIDSLIDGFGYNVYRKRMEKLAVLCALAGSVQIGEEGSGIPPMIHVLFVGDAGTYKSTIMKYILRVFRKSIRVDSKTVSNAGLKAITVKMPDGNMAIRAGLLPMYNNGVIFMDEFGLLTASLYDDLRNPMIDGVVVKDMGGEHFHQSAKTGILGSMNPADDSWDFAKGIHDNLIPPLDIPLITRFDLIFVFSTKSPDYDKEAIKAHFNQCDNYGKGADLLTDDEIERWLNYIRTLEPRMTTGILSHISDFFTDIDRKRKEHGKDEVNIRTENAVKKLSVALARLHGASVVSINHASEAINLYKYSMKTFGMDVEKGEILAESAIKKTADGRMIALKKAYDTIKDEDGYCFEDALLTEVMKYEVFKNGDSVKNLLHGQLTLRGMVSTKNNMITIDFTIS